MKKTKKKARKRSGLPQKRKEKFSIGEIVLYWSEFNGVRVGAAPVNIAVFGYPMDAYAVATEDDRWLSTRSDCIAWIADKTGADEFVAKTFIELAETVADREAKG